MEIVTLILVALALVVGAATLYVMAAKPRLEVYIQDKDGNWGRQTAVPAGTQQTLQVLFRNTGDNILGRLSLKKPAATRLTAFIYFHPETTILSAWRSENAMVAGQPQAGDLTVYRASASGLFAGMRYIAVPSVYGFEPPAISIVSYEEDVICSVHIEAPAEVGNHPIRCQMVSAEGDLGVRSLEMKVV